MILSCEGVSLVLISRMDTCDRCAQEVPVASCTVVSANVICADCAANYIAGKLKNFVSLKSKQNGSF